jgi:hypothetical protein
MRADAARRTPAGRLQRLVVRVFRLHGLLAAAGDALARPAGQTSARWQVLAMVEEADRHRRRDGADAGLARQSVQRVAICSGRGPVVYADNPRHRGPG